LAKNVNSDIIHSPSSRSKLSLVTKQFWGPYIGFKAIQHDMGMGKTMTGFLFLDDLSL